MFCPNCGKTEEKLFDNLCKSCFLEDVVLAEIPDQIEITICAHCESHLEKGKWHDLEMSDEEVILNTLNDHITLNKYAQDVEIDLELILEKGSTLEFIVHIKGSVLGELIEQDYKLNVKINRNVCPECSKYMSGYYEAVIQLRADNRNPDEEEISTIDMLLADNVNKIAKKNKMAYIAERVVLKEGVDYYVGSYKVAKRLSNILKEQVGGVVKESPRLMGRDKSAGKDLYRTWISLRIPYFKVHDFIKDENILGQVTGIEGRRISIKDLVSHSQTSVQWRDYDKLETVARKEDIMETTVTAKTPHSIQILHPVSYEPLDIKMTPETADIEIGSQVPVVEIEGNVYILGNFKDT